MPDVRNQDLSGASYDDVSLRGAHFERVSFANASLRAIDLTNADLRGVDFTASRLRGVELVDVEISGELRNVMVNGVDIAPLVEAELDRRMPERPKMRPVHVDEFREAWTILERLWETTIDRARRFTESQLHESIDGEWSFIQTLRHLNFACAAWVDRMLLGVVSPWSPLDIPWDEAPGWEGIPWDRDARPGLDDVLEVRRDRHASVHRVLEGLTEGQLGSEVTMTEPGWPQTEGFSFRECLRIVVNEEWEHRGFAERDLAHLQIGG